MRDKKEKIIWILLCCLVFAGFSFFFIKIHPMTIFDTDDWTYLTFTRQSKLLPSKSEWNPIKVFPENMIPLSVCLGKPFLEKTGLNFYSAVISGMGLVFSLFAMAYVMLLARLVTVRIRLRWIEGTCLVFFIVFIHFIPLLRQDAGNGHFFSAASINCVFNYTIPTLLNAILVCLAIIHEDDIRHFFSKKHWVCKTVYAVLIYFAIFSNLSCSIVFVVFSGMMCIKYFFIEARDHTTDRVDKLIQCSVYIYAIILWVISMIFEISGGRANQLSGATFDVKGSFMQFVGVIKGKNIVFNVILIASLVFYVVMLIHVLRNKDRYLKPLIDRLRVTSKKKRDEIVISEEDELCFKYVNWASLWIACAVLTVVFLILLNAKTGGGYFGHIAVQLDFYLFLLMNVYMVLAFLMKKQNKAIYGVAAVAALMAYMSVFGSGTYAAYTIRGYSNETCKALADYIVEQYVEADRSGVEIAQIHVPDFGTEDNFPIANYGNMRIANTLYNYGVTSRFVMSEFVIDSKVNDRFGL